MKTIPLRLISLVSTALLVIVLYGQTAGFLLFLDDTPHFQWLVNQSFAHMWISSEGFPLYRPATFFVWQLADMFIGRNPIFLHVLSISLHLINSLLVSLLASRLSREERAGLWAGLIYAAFPFSYGAVVLVAAQFHLWQTFGLLLASWLLLVWLEHPVSRARLTGGWLAALWGIFNHENGLIAPVLIGLLLLLSVRGSILKAWRRLALALIPIAVFSAVYFMMRSVALESSGTPLHLDGMAAKFIQAGQVIGYPIAALLRLWLDPDNGSMLAAISGIAVLVLWLGSSFYRMATGEARQIAWLVLGGLGWLLVAMCLAWLFVPTDYLWGSVRVYYLAAVGVALSWGSLLSRPLPGTHPLRWQWAIGIAGGMLCLLTAVPFVWGRMTIYSQVDAVFHQIGQITHTVSQSHPESQLHILVINAPTSQVPARLFYLVGSEGTVYLPEYVPLIGDLWVNGFIDTNHPPSVLLRDSPDTALMPVDAAALETANIQQADTVISVIMNGNALQAVVSGARSSVPAAPRPLAVFENGVILENGSLRFAGDQAIITLFWRIDQRPLAEVNVFVHLECDDTLISQADGAPLGRVYPFSQWQPGERWQDNRYLTVAGLLDPACLMGKVGLYDPASGKRISVTLSDDKKSDAVPILAGQD
jgi:hypothetical protein